MPRPGFILAIVLGASLHALGIVRSDLPAQDGLKFIRVAKQFQERPWVEVVRKTDQHPLYPALIAATEPVVRPILGRGPDAWRVAAQLVSAVASLALLIPLWNSVRHLFGDSVADTAGLVWVLLPLPSAFGRDTLSDPTAWLAFAWAWRFGQKCLDGNSRADAIGCGLVAGIGFLARPEIVAVPLAVGLVAAWRSVRVREFRSLTTQPVFALAACLAVMGGYALVKGEVSEKLALRRVVALPPSATGVVSPNALPKGLDDHGWDLAPKEEHGRTVAMGPGMALIRTARSWAEDLGGIVAVFAIIGLFRRRTRAEAGGSVRLTLVYAVLFAVVLVRHATVAGYLSARHTMTLALVALPWAAASLTAFVERISSGIPRFVSVAALIVVGVVCQLREPHPSRWGHREAGRWLVEHAKDGETILDTRGWAAFVSGLPAYTPWQFGKALRDDNLSYIVVGADELAVGTGRGRSLAKLLDVAGTRVAAFPGRRESTSLDVLVYRFQAPESWEGLTP